MKKIFTLFILLVGFCSTTMAQEYAAELKVSTLGINAEVVRSLSNSVNVKVGAAFMSLTVENDGGEGDDYSYSGDLKLTSFSVLADYFPFSAYSFRFTGGILINLNKVDLTLSPLNTYTVGGDVYTPDKLGNLDAEVKFNPVAPYIGIGFGNPVSGPSGFKFTIDIGTAYHGTTDIDMTATGLLAPSAAPDQEQVLMDNLAKYQWYPVVSLGIGYKF